MTGSGGADRRGIEVPAETAEAARMPDDLDANAAVEYSVPDVGRRRQAAWVYVSAAAGMFALAAGGVSDGLWFLGGGLVAIAGYHLLAGRSLVVREDRALEVANRATSFPVGHASATLGFRGPLARPVWNVLVFSADDPPSERGLVRVDAYDGDVIEQYVEKVEPES
jgi:hypothetical protein